MHWYCDPMTLATVVIAGAAIVNLLVSFMLWRATANATDITKKIFEASHRPYIGIPQVDTNFDPINHPLQFVCVTKNFGSIPAHDVEVLETQVIRNGEPVNLDRDEFGKFSVFPQSQTFHQVNIRNVINPAHALRNDRIELRVEFRYKGAYEKYYRYKYRALYNPQGPGQFVQLGEDASEQ